jgi:hypothetical protein
MRFSCRYCGKGFDSSKSGAKYCSRPCLKAGGRGRNRKERSDKGKRKPGTKLIKTNCSGCGKEFERRESDALKSKNIYCDQECYGKNGAHLTRGGRPRKRPGGKGLPPHAQPETLRADDLWPVRSWFDDKGYTLLYMPECPYAPPSTGRIYEHRLIMSMELGRRLERTEHVDHITPISEGGTNERSNLQIMTPSNHMKKTASENVTVWRNFTKEVKNLGLSPDEALEILRRSINFDAAPA